MIRYIKRPFHHLLNASLPLLPDFRVVNNCINHLQYFRCQRKTINENQLNDITEYIFTRKNSPSLSNYGYFVDKDLVKQMIASLLGPNLVIPTLGVYRTIAELETFSCNTPYIVKPTHMSAKLIIKQSGSLTKPELKECQKWLGSSYFKHTREYNYRFLEPKVIIEPLIKLNGDIPPDYKFFVINKTCQLIQVDSNRFSEHKRDFYTANWDKLPIKLKYPNATEVMPRPDNLEEMVNIAEKIGGMFGFSRIDLYDTDDGIRFGEITLTPNNASQRFEPASVAKALYQEILRSRTASPDVVAPRPVKELAF